MFDMGFYSLFFQNQINMERLKPELDWFFLGHDLIMESWSDKKITSQLKTLEPIQNVIHNKINKIASEMKLNGIHHFRCQKNRLFELVFENHKGLIDFNLIKTL